MANFEKSTNPIYCQDEILQMMYWMRGEDLGKIVTLAELNRFLKLDKEHLKANVRRLVEVGNLEYVEQQDGVQRVKLTARGVVEGKRRFSEEFEPYLGQESHIECNDPDCDCHNPNYDGICQNLTNELRQR